MDVSDSVEKNLLTKCWEWILYIYSPATTCSLFAWIPGFALADNPPETGWYGNRLYFFRV